MSDINAIASMLVGRPQRRDPYDPLRQFGQRTMMAGASTAPVQSPLEGLSRALQAGMGGYFAGEADRQSAARSKNTNAALARALGAGTPEETAAHLKDADLDPDTQSVVMSQLLSQKLSDQRKAQLGQRAYAAAGGMPGQPGPGLTIDMTRQPGGYQGTLAGHEGGTENGGMVFNRMGSGAYGPHQFTPETWADVRAKAPGLNLPADFTQASREQHDGAEKALRQINGGEFAKMGVPVNDATLYLAHRAGPQGAQAILGASPDTPLSIILPPRWLQQNPDMRTTAGEFVKMAQSRFPAPGGAQLPQGSPAVSPAASGGQNPPSNTNFDAGSEYEVLGRRAAASGDWESATKYQQQANVERAKFRTGQYEYDRKRAGEQATGEQKRSDEQTRLKTEDENKLRDDFDKAGPVKSYRVVVPMLESAKDAAKRPTRAADINLIYAFAKLMDPDSVVRESETGMVQASATVADRLQGLVGQLNGNPMLQPATRAKLIDELQSRFNALETSYKAHEEAYKGIADRRGHTFDNIRIPIRAEGAVAGGPVAPTAAGGTVTIKSDADYDALPSGATFVAPDGSTRRKP